MPAAAVDFNALVNTYGADPTGTSDSSKAFQNASDALTFLPITPGVYRLDKAVKPRSGQTWFGMGSTLLQTGKDNGLIDADGADNLSISNVKLLCNFGGGSSNQALFRVSDCLNLKVSQLSIRGAVNIGLLFDPNAHFRYGNRAQFSQVDFLSCFKGLVVLAEGTPNTDVEYNCFSHVNAEDCMYPVIIGAGNTRIMGGNIKYNANGIRLLGGSNCGHGVLSGVFCNHNTNNNLHADSVVNGFTVSDCHFYGDDAVGNGRISILNSKGIVISGGKVDCLVTVDGDTGNNFMNGVCTPGTFYSVSGANPERMVVTNRLIP